MVDFQHKLSREIVNDGQPAGTQSQAKRKAQRKNLLALAYAAAAVLTLAAVLVVTNPGSWRARLFNRAAAPPIQSLAVLPLANLSHDPEQDYFADGMTEALIANLAQVSALRVISRTSVMRYKGTDKTLPQIARDLNVDALIEGTVQRALMHSPTRGLLRRTSNAMCGLLWASENRRI